MATVMSGLLSAVRKRYGSHLQLKQVAAGVKSYSTYINKLENGTISAPSKDLLIALLKQYAETPEVVSTWLTKVRDWIDTNKLTATDPGLHGDPTLEICPGDIRAQFICTTSPHEQIFDVNDGQEFVLFEVAFRQAVLAARKADAKARKSNKEIEDDLLPSAIFRAYLGKEHRRIYVMPSGGFKRPTGVELHQYRDGYCLNEMLIVSPSREGTVLSADAERIEQFDFAFKGLKKAALSPEAAQALFDAQEVPAPKGKKKMERLPTSAEVRRDEGGPVVPEREDEDEVNDPR